MSWSIKVVGTPVEVSAAVDATPYMPDHVKTAIKETIRTIPPTNENYPGAMMGALVVASGHEGTPSNIGCLNYGGGMVVEQVPIYLPPAVLAAFNSGASSA